MLRNQCIQNPLPRSPQHNLVDLPQATLTRHGVLIDLNLEIFRLLSNLLYLPSDIFIYLLDFF